MNSADLISTVQARPAGRTLDEFGELTLKESEILDECRAGKSPRVAPVLPTQATPKNVVRASFIRFLILGGDETAPVHERGVEVTGAWIQGGLDLHAAKVGASVKFKHCHFVSKPDLTDAHIHGSVAFFSSRLPGLNAERMTCTGFLNLRKTVFDGDVRISSAHIGSTLNCSGASFQGSGATAVHSAGVTVGGNVSFSNGATMKGILDLQGSKVNGSVYLDGAMLEGRPHAVMAERIVIGGGFFLRKAIVTGECRLLGARIGSGCNLREAKLTGVDGPAFAADRAHINGNLTFSEATVDGLIRFLSAEITGSCDVVDAAVSNEGNEVFALDRAVIGGNLAFTGSSVRGSVRLSGVHVHGDLSFSGTSLSCAGRPAVLAQRANVGRNVFFIKHCHVAGEIDLSGMRIGGDLTLRQATLENEHGFSIFADGVIVEGEFAFAELTKPACGVHLSSSRVGRLLDDELSWGDGLVLDGFRYETLTGQAPTNALARLRWLDKQRPEHCGKNGTCPDFRPQPWRQLRRVLTELGHFEDARQIAIAYEERTRLAGLVGQSPPGRNKFISWLNRSVAVATHYLFGALIAYGYRPRRLLAWFMGVWVACGILYWVAASEGVMAPSNPLVFQHPAYSACLDKSGEAGQGKKGDRKEDAVKGAGNWYLCAALPEEYTGFSPLAYSLDVLLPFVDLQQERDWAPKVPTPKAVWDEELVAVSLKHVTRLVLWFEIIFGWLASLLLVAVVSGLTKRVEE